MTDTFPHPILTHKALHGSYRPTVGTDAQREGPLLSFLGWLKLGTCPAQLIFLGTRSELARPGKRARTELVQVYACRSCRVFIEQRGTRFTEYPWRHSWLPARATPLWFDGLGKEKPS